MMPREGHEIATSLRSSYKIESGLSSPTSHRSQEQPLRSVLQDAEDLGWDWEKLI
jgi:hypothetical protein